MIGDDFLIDINKNNDNTILFLLSPVEINMLKKSSIKKIKKMLLELKSKKFRLVLKGHPRLGFPEGLENYFEVIVPNHIPSEFINYKNINITIGIISSSLNYIVSVPEAKVYSIIDFLDFKIPEKRIFYKKYLTELSDSKIIFLEENKLLNG